MNGTNTIPQFVQALSDERNLPSGVIFEALEVALATALRRSHAENIEARVEIDRVSGASKYFRRWQILADDEVEDYDRQIPLSEARNKNADAAVGQYIEETVPSIAVERISAQTVRQVIMQKVREAERKRVYDEFSTQIGEMVFCTVKRIERGDVIMDLNGIDAILPKDNCIPRNGMRSGDHVRAILKEVKLDARGPQLVLDRLGSELLIELFKLEVPETRQGLVTIKCAARFPGERAKIAVHSEDAVKTDAIGACVGVRGSRVQSVSNEIAGERIDIVQWSRNIVQFVINALAPAQVKTIVVESASHSMDVVVDKNQLSIAIGRGGQNVGLASQLTGWELNILTVEQAEEKAEEERRRIQAKLVEQLDVDEDVAAILVENGYTDVIELVYEDPENLSGIEHFDEELAQEIQNRAVDAVLKLEMDGLAEVEENIPDETLYQVEDMDEETALNLAAHGIRTMEDLADCATYELLDIPGFSQARAEKLIMNARAPMFAALQNDSG